MDGWVPWFVKRKLSDMVVLCLWLNMTVKDGHTCIHNQMLQKNKTKRKYWYRYKYEVNGSTKMEQKNWRDKKMKKKKETTAHL